jgi:hypothetical protein
VAVVVTVDVALGAAGVERLPVLLLELPQAAIPSPAARTAAHSRSARRPGMGWGRVRARMPARQ